MRTLSAAFAALVVLVACGGGSMSGTGMTSMQKVATSGTITAFGSVFVNGVRYDVSAATLKKNGLSVTQSGLAVGEVALVQGHQDLQSGHGDASSVEVEDNVVGPIATIDTMANQLTVLGQTVAVTASTSFGQGISPADLTGLAVGDAIEVSGFAGAGGVIAATRIGRAEANEPLQVLGTVAGLDATAHTFMINGLTVDYSAAMLSGFPAGQPANDDLVVARGTVFDSAAVKLTATSVQRAEIEPRDVADGGHVEQEGLITRFASATDFDVGDQKVTTTADTRFEGGTVTDLALNVRVEVRGMLDASGVLIAEEIEISHIAAIELESAVTAVDATNNSLTVLGVAITVDSNTRFEDRSSAQVQLFTLANVSVGDTVEIRGYESPAGSGQVLATRLERLPPSTRVEVRGPFTATTPPQFMILAITIDATNASFGVQEDEQTLSAADFYTQAVGQIVEVRGTATGSTVTATEVRIDHDEDR
jgi:Domain of unknown function (DUF5666)